MKDNKTVISIDERLFVGENMFTSCSSTNIKIRELKSNNVS